MRRHLLLALLLIAACNPQPVEQASSWVATLQLTGERWLGNSVPASFARATIDAAVQALQSADRSDIAPQVAVARAAAGDMQNAIEKNDRRAVARAVQRLAEVHAQLQKAESP